MKVLDLFAGLKGWSQPFADRGHECFSIDIDSKFDVSVHADILTFDIHQLPFKPDIILASPPCEGFSVMNIGRNWTREHQPKTETAQMALSLIIRTLNIIEQIQPQFFIIENPRAKLRRLAPMADLERRTVTYCQYGEHRMKPTDLWGGFPPSLLLKPPCKNGASCHIRAPRGSRTGTQGMDSALSAKIPYALALNVCIAAEKDLTPAVSVLS